MKAYQEARPGALVEVKHVMALKHKEVIVRHVPKLLSKITYFYLKHDGDLLARIIGKKQFSKNLPQGGMELPILYVFKSTNLVMYSKIPGFVSDVMKTYNGAKSKTLETKDKPKKKKKKKCNMHI